MIAHSQINLRSLLHNYAPLLIKMHACMHELEKIFARLRHNTMQKVGIYRHLNMLLVNLIQTKQFVPFPYKSRIDNAPKGGKNISININPDVFNAIQNSYQYRIATSLSIYISINSYKYNSQVK